MDRLTTEGRDSTGSPACCTACRPPRTPARARLKIWENTCLCLFIALAFSACAAFRGYPDPALARDAELAELAQYIGAAQTAKCRDQPGEPCRNRIIAARMYAIDLQFAAYEEALYRGTREAAFGATLATLGLTSAAAVASGGTSQALSGTAALIIGGREAFQKEILTDRTVIAIQTAMHGKRAQIAARILAGLRQNIDAYPLDIGLRELDQYYRAGTIPGAVMDITESVGVTARESEKNLQATLAFRVDEGTDKLRQAICRGSPACATPDTTRFPEIRACWPSAGVPAGTLMTDFMFNEKFAAARIQVAQCMKL
jgi:hypothetical protein